MCTPQHRASAAPNTLPGSCRTCGAPGMSPPGERSSVSSTAGTYGGVCLAGALQYVPSGAQRASDQLKPWGGCRLRSQRRQITRGVVGEAGLGMLLSAQPVRTANSSLPVHRSCANKPSVAAAQTLLCSPLSLLVTLSHF